MSAQEPGTTNTKYNVTYIATKEITTSQNDEIDCLGIKLEAGPVILGDAKCMLVWRLTTVYEWIYCPLTQNANVELYD